MDGLCECVRWARVEGRATNHHSRCPEFKEETFAALEHDGAKCIVELRDLADMIACAESDYIVRPVKMTREEFDRIPEFQGF